MRLEAEELLDALPDALFFLLGRHDGFALCATQSLGRLLPVEVPGRSGALAVEGCREVNRRNALLRREVEAAVAFKCACREIELCIGAGSDVYGARHDVFECQLVAVERKRKRGLIEVGTSALSRDKSRIGVGDQMIAHGGGVQAEIGRAQYAQFGGTG